MRALLLLPWLYLAAVLQLAWASGLEVAGVTPNLLAIAGLTFLLLVPEPRGFLVIGLFGLAADLLIAGRPGPALAAYLLSGYLLHRLIHRQKLNGLAPQWIVLWLSCSLLELITLAGGILLGELPLGPLQWLQYGLAGGLYTALCGLPLLMVVRWLREFLDARGAVAPL